MLVRNFKQVVPYRLQNEGADGAYVRPLVSEEDGVSDFQIVLLRLDPGGCTPMQGYSYTQQMFIRKGDGELTHESESWELSEGDVVLSREEEEFQIRNTSDEKDLEVLICKPDTKRKPFEAGDGEMEENPSTED